MTRARTPLLAALAFVLVWLLVPSTTRAAPACTDLSALLDLPPAEQRAFEAACAGTLVDAEPREQLYLGLDRLLRIGGWRATLAMRSLAERSSLAPDPPVVAALQDLLDNPGACKALDSAITDFLADRAQDKVPRQVGLEALIRDLVCAKHFEPLRRDLDPLLEDYALLTYVGEPGDDANVLILDRDAERLVRVAHRLEHPLHRGLQLLLVPRGQRLLVVVEQVEHDLAWTLSRTYNRNARLERRNEVACLDAEFAADAQFADPLVLVDGQPIAARLLEHRSTSEDEHSQLRMVLSLPPGEHELMLVPLGRIDAQAADQAGEALTIAEAIAAQIGIERRLTTPADICTSLSQDFRGLQTNQTRYGIAQIVVDERCREGGLASARIRRHIEQYVADLDHVRLEQLDAWSETLSTFQSLQQPSEASASRGPLDDGQRSARLAEEVMRQGVDSLLFFELRCSEDDDQVDFLGTQIDLRSYSLRPKSKSAGTETLGLRRTRLHTAPTSRAREALDVVLGDLFGTGHVRVDEGAGGLRGLRHYVTVAAEYPSASSPEIEVEIHRVPGVGELGAGKRRFDVCARLDAFNGLGLEHDLAELHADAASMLERSLLVHTDYNPATLEPTADAEAEEGLASWEGVVEASGLAAGQYVVWVMRRPTPESAPDRLDARCFEVSEQALEFFASFSAGIRTRGNNPDFNPRHDQANHLRLVTGLRASSRWFIEGGGLLGYEHVQYESDTTPSWEEFGAIELTDTGRGDIDWSRHGLLLGGFVGVDLPFSACVWRTRLRRTCAGRTARFSAFLDAYLVGNLGFIDTKALPSDFTGISANFDPDLDVSLHAGLRILTSPRTRLALFFGSTWSDIESAIMIARNPQAHAPTAGLLTFDYAWRWSIGAELAFVLSSR